MEQEQEYLEEKDMRNDKEKQIWVISNSHYCEMSFEGEDFVVREGDNTTNVDEWITELRNAGFTDYKKRLVCRCLGFDGYTELTFKRTD